ncbi:MAG: winged helix-turn-helix domain-containing protein [Nitrososphaerota archaeon]|nr:winged helix-turn-helix domain-containing protein [Nitrososphaerota archaeon]
MKPATMGAFDKIKRRNLDYLLIETIKQIGVSNYSLLARMTGINPETVRYKVNKQLTKYGLGVQVNLNHAELGMSAGLMVVDAEPSQEWLGEVSYLFFEGKAIGASKYVGLYAVPFRFKKKYIDVMSFLKQQKRITDYAIYEAKWLRYPSFRPEFYDFDAKKWKVDWRRVEMTQGESGATTLDVNRDAEVDYMDVKILKAMQENPTVSIVKVAAEIGANPRTLRYHNAEHVVKGKLILNSNVRWKRPAIEGKPGELMQMLTLVKGVGQEGVVKTRKVMNKIPFTWLEGGSEVGDYFALLDVPMDKLYETTRYIESNTEDVRSSLSIIMLDSQKSRYLHIPEEMFDPKRGWTLPSYRQEMAKIGDGEERRHS